MIVELCLVLRIVFNENQQHAFQGASIDSCKATSEAKDVQQKTVTKISSNNYVSTPDTWENNPDLKTLWVYRPPSIIPNQPQDETSHVVFRAPHLITKLAKPFSYGFDPFFQKRDFEPFERRQRPVTLVTFRKNGVQPRKSVNPSQDSAEVAEIQSSFNDITTFWQDAPGAF